MMVLTRVFAIAVLCSWIVLPRGAAAENITADIATIKSSSPSQQLISACNRLMAAMFASVPAGMQSTLKGDAALDALRTFVLAGHDTRARIRCARYLGDASKFPMESGNTSKTWRLYAEGANAIVLAMFEDRNSAIRVGAANALWGTRAAENGRALLRHAETDPAPAVVAASLQNMMWPMEADISQSDDAKAYDSAIARGLGSTNEAVVVGALAAYASLHRASADALLRRYALDRRATVRVGAINAYGSMGMYNASIMSFVESRLNDASEDVRDAVMLRLLNTGDAHALPAIRRLAKTAPTARERASAAEYAKAIAEEARQ